MNLDPILKEGEIDSIVGTLFRGVQGEMRMMHQEAVHEKVLALQMISKVQRDGLGKIASRIISKVQGNVLEKTVWKGPAMEVVDIRAADGMKIMGPGRRATVKRVDTTNKTLTMECPSRFLTQPLPVAFFMVATSSLQR
jgi:hypothetical protein